MIHRNSTWDLEQGFDRIRWTDRVEEVRALYPRCWERRRREGVAPWTGELVVQTAGLQMEDFALPLPADGFALCLSVAFDDRGVTSLALDCFGADGVLEYASPEAWAKAKVEWVALLIERMGLEPIDHSCQTQSWSRPGLVVTLWWDSSFSLEFVPQPDRRG